MTDWHNSDNWHYAANIFPLMPPDELAALAADIKSNGLLNPIIRCSGKILDGRNRALACFAAGRELKFKDVSKKQAEAWACSQNIYRRFLKPEQQAFALAALSLVDESKPLGKKRLRAYHVLKQLKASVFPLIEKAKSGEDVSAELTALFKPKKRVEVKRNIFDILNEKLHLFEPSWSDGDEHLFIRQIEEAINLKPRSEIEEHHKKALISMLERLSQDFLKYAEKLKNKA
jgi:hypothetical protein